jgi:SSS family solute:Na+ symporter
MTYLAAETLTLSLGALDIALLVVYFTFVIGIGFALKRMITTSTDFFLSGRSLPAWVTGIAFISANLGAIEILGMAASGAQYGISIVHYYWIGAIPAMVFLGIVMMPFYYGSKVRSVPEYLVRRYDQKTHLVNAIIFVLSSILIAGVNLYALASVLEALLGIPLAIAIVVSALFVLSYILLGGLTSAIYNEVMQFFVICAGLIPVVIVALTEVGGVSGLFQKLSTQGPAFTHPWVGLGPDGGNPIGDWIGLILGLSFCLSFGYWTTNFAEVQRAMSAKDDNAARLTPIVGAFPKIIIPMAIVIPGMAAVLLLPGLGESGGLPYNDAIPGLMNKYLPTGVLGVAITGLLAAFMAGMAANVSSFNAVFTYDIWQNYIRPGRPDAYYLQVGRYITIVGVFIGILTAFLASGYSNINNYFQTLFSFFNVPIFLAFIVGMFWTRAGRGSGFWGMLVGTLTSFGVFILYKAGVVTFRSDLNENQWAAIIAFIVGLIAMVIATRFSEPKPEAELEGLVFGRQKYVSAPSPQPERVAAAVGAGSPQPRRGAAAVGEAEASPQPQSRRGAAEFVKNPVVLGMLALAFCVVMYIYIELVNP